MISATLLVISSIVLGIFLGGQITEAFLFVPYWKAQHPDEFFTLHKTYGKKIYLFFAPLTIAATILPLLAVAYHFVYQTKENDLFALMGISVVLFFSTYFLYFKKANKKFAERSIANNELSDELVKWGNWHWARLVFEFIAFVISLILLLKI